jgi:hypothetical protein
MTSNEISASFHTLMEQASMTADVYLGEAVERIDRQFGAGYAAKNPALVGAFIQACSDDFSQGVLAQQIRLGLEAIAEAGTNIASAIDTGVSGVADNLCGDRMAEALGNIATCIDDAGVRGAIKEVAGEIEQVASALREGL